MSTGVAVLCVLLTAAAVHIGIGHAAFVRLRRRAADLALHPRQADDLALRARDAEKPRG